MPGLASMNAGRGQQSPVKLEAEELDDFLLDEDEQQDEVSYKSRPQLPQPGTFLRTLDFLMSELLRQRSRSR